MVLTLFEYFADCIKFLLIPNGLNNEQHECDNDVACSFKLLHILDSSFLGLMSVVNCFGCYNNKKIISSMLSNKNGLTHFSCLN